jgi:hypothetical protein
VWRAPKRDNPRIISTADCGAMTGTTKVPVSDMIEIESPGTLVNPLADEV